MAMGGSFAFSGRTALLVVLGLVALTGCTKKQHAKENLEVTELRYLGGAGTVSLPELAQELGYLAPLKLKWVGDTFSGPQSIQATASGDTDFGVAFTGSIVNLVKAKAPIRMVISTAGLNAQSWTGYYVLEESPINSGPDLIGKKVAMNTLGAHHEFMVREYLLREGISREEIKQVSLLVVPPANGEQTLRQKQVDLASLGGINKDMALERGGIRPLFTDYQLFGKLSTAGFVMTDKFIRDNPKAAGKFVEATARAIEWTKTRPRQEVIARMEKIVRERGRNENALSLRYWKSFGIDGKGGLIAEKEVQVWIDWLVRDGQLGAGEVKACDVYTNRFNPYRAESKTQDLSSK